MADIQPVTRDEFAGRSWQRYTDYHFAAGDSLCPLALQELPRAMSCLPVAFIAVEGGYMPAAIQSLEPGRNLLVAPNGQWLFKYVPALYRGYPFVLGKTGNDDKRVLCVNMDSGLVRDDTEGEEAFFDEQGEATPFLRELMDFLNQVTQGREAAARVCRLLDEHGLIRPWELNVQKEDGKQRVEGLFHIDEQALNALDGEALKRLIDCGALAVAYGQMMSAQHFDVLKQTAQLHARASEQAAKRQTGPELQLDPISDSGSISFDNL